MSYKRWDIYYALAPHYEDPTTTSRHPVLIWTETEAFVVSFKMTSTDRGNMGMEYRLREWAAAGLDHETSVRLEQVVRINKEQIQEYVGTVQPADKLSIERKLTNGR